MKPLDLACEVVTEKLFDNPEALRQLTVLEKHYANIERKKEQLKLAENFFKKEAAIMSNILDLLGAVRYDLTASNFYVLERTYREVKLVDKSAFMAWLKENAEPQEILELLTPPTKLSDVKKFIERKFTETTEFDFEIPGVITKNTFTILKGYRYGEKSKHYKKENNEKDGYRKDRTNSRRRK